MNKNAAPVAPGIPLAVAASGGVDSMSLLHMLRHHQPVFAISINQGLRPASAQECIQVEQWCAAMNIPHTTLRWEHADITRDIQQKARNARYRLLFDWCHTHNITHLATAHHLDDQIETIIFRLLRGSGLVGMAGILPTSMREGITLHRPLLAYTKSELIDYLAAQQQPWLEDESNRSLAYTRNRLRAYLLPLTVEEKKRLHHITLAFQRFRQGLEAKIFESYRTCVSGQQLHHPRFMALPQEIRLLLLQHICQQLGHNTEPLRSEKLARLLAAIEKGSGKTMLHGVMFHYHARIAAWTLTRTKPLAAQRGYAMNE